jgi:hypothetical protein
MQPMLKLVPMLILGQAGDVVRRHARSLALRIVLTFGATLLLLIALLFFLMAAYAWLSGLLSPILAAAILGAGASILSLTMLLAAARCRPKPLETGDAGKALAGALGEISKSLSMSPAILMASLALIVGLRRRSKLS